jgi:hypothetical protein
MGLQIDFWNKLNKVQDILFLDDERMSSLLELTEHDFVNFRANSISLDLNRMDQLLDRIGISLNSFFEETYDINLLRKRFLGSVYDLPERYSLAQFSRTRTLTNCLKYIELKYGVHIKNSILRGLQIDPRFFDDPDRLTNINLMKDLLTVYSGIGLNADDFISMGKMSYLMNKEGAFGELCRAHQTVEDLVIDLCENHSHKFDQNYEYSVSKIEDGAIYISSRPSENSLEYFSMEEMGSDEICFTKLGVFGSFPYYLGQGSSYAEKTKCMREGNSSYEYKILYK